jgi:hypothetical protein
MPPLAALLFLLSPLAAPAAPAGPDPAAELPTLAVRELTLEGGSTLRPSPRALALATQHVRLVGFMVRQEEQSPGGFWLASRPVECDEGGAGTGDLPPGSVRVLMTDLPPGPYDGPIAVTGILEVGSDDGHDGPPSSFRLRVERAGSPFNPKQ